MSTSPSPAPAWRRLAAIVYDLLLVVAIVMVVGLVAQFATGGRLVDAHGQIVAWWYRPLQGLAIGGYFLWSWVRGGQTLGMRPWRIRVSDANGRAVTWRRGLLRLVVAAAPLALLAVYPLTSVRIALWAPLVAWALWLLPSFVDTRRRALHDIVARTEIRRTAT
ncbi:Uncharacterized membrane protein YckC, RDD family [Luteibacter sp. UNC138MFCol5.1]|uniref:RDD family protein n=1 Tax=Luteibacter sp. UNC138MFCol5.1 TaxID=1502774 RepID=UPI0008AAD43B|nr:RDD family protein [Luteibacter sp. UNC138MFCol5.1]SEP11091.1 Uncharacterized membrane protein YckC, RDD family [Luteibacter sp. UNC138MFCol5.1]